MEKSTFEQDKIASGIEEKIRAVSILADLRLKEYELRISAGSLKIPDIGDNQGLELHNNSKNKITREVNGDNILDKEGAEEFLKQESILRKRISTNKKSDPNFSAFLLASIIKAKQVLEQDFSLEMSEIEEITKSVKNLPALSLTDLLPKAMILGIQKRETTKFEKPNLTEASQIVLTNDNFLKNYALVLSESEREDFLKFIPEDRRSLIEAQMDKELSMVLPEKTLTEKDKTEFESVRSRTKKSLEKIAGGQDDGIRMVKLLAETLQNLGGDEDKATLADIAKKLASPDRLLKEKGISYSARLLRSLNESDAITGGGIVVSFLGKKEIGQEYFDYFLKYLANKKSLILNLDGVESWSEDKSRKVFDFLIKNNSTDGWADQENVIEPLKRGAEIFGYSKIIAYAGRPDVGPHDALFAFDKIIDLFKQSGLSAGQFYDQVLNQVRKDTSSYDSDKLSYQYFNEIAQSINLESGHLQKMKIRAEQYSNIDKLKDLVSYFSDKRQIFSSWSSLRRFSELVEFLGKAEILEELQELKEESLTDEDKAKLYRFIETLVFHPNSKVEMKAVLQFWRNPQDFLELGDAHTPEAVHGKKKPSNYTEIPNLDLNAVELRDALVCGDLDRIQVFPPMEVIYSVGRNEDLKMEMSFFEEVRREVGSYKEGTVNKLLFNALKKIFSEFKLNILDYVKGDSEAFDKLGATDKTIIETRVKEAMREFPNPKIERKSAPMTKRYRAKINAKSDPQGVLAGNDTSCCMPFGSGKNNIYMFNPNCSLFTLEEEKGTGWKTVAQSVLTFDQDVGLSIPNIVGNLQKGDNSMSEVLPEAVLTQNEFYLACDNIEVTPGAKNKTKLIESVYSDFFEKYLKRYNERNLPGRLNEKKIIIGQDNSDARFGTQANNTFIPAAPVGYSDKLGPNVFVIEFAKGGSDFLIKPEFSTEVVSNSTEETKLPAGIHPLTFRDSLAVSFLEGKAYADNISLVEHLHNMENGLIAKDINNEIKRRPNLSVKYVDSAGRMRGYLMAYEGRDELGREVVYIADLASDMTSRLAGGRLVNSFIEMYKEKYLDSSRFTPIFLQARENTSYKLIKDNLKSIERKLGIKLKLEEKGSYKSGKDTMHEVWLYPEK